jgi:hypothetical protein
MTVLVLSHPDDLHAVRVIEALQRRNQRVVLLNLADLPERASLSVEFADPTAPVAVLHQDGAAPVPLDDLTSVWWRRPQFPSLESVTSADALGFCHGEWHELLYGLYELLDRPWMNDPAANERGSRKALQLREAARLGLRVPDTVMTSDPATARRFAERHGLDRTIYKIFAATPQVWRETRLLSREDLDHLDTLRFAPVIFQEYVPAAADVRVTIVGRDLFAMAIHSRGTSYEVDFRVSLAEARTEPVDLPDAVAAQLLQLMDRLGLVYGAADLRLTPDGEYVFLEINPAGEFLFCEHGAGYPLTEAVAGWLADPVVPDALRPDRAEVQLMRRSRIST